MKLERSLRRLMYELPPYISNPEHERKRSQLLPVITASLQFKRDNDLDAEEIVRRYAFTIRKSFSVPIKEGAVPVLICAWNEAEQLPKLLKALSASTFPVKPVIVDNNSSDGTDALAKDLGTIVLSEKEQGLMHALVKGFQFLTHHKDVAQFLLTDADTYPFPWWAESMRKKSSEIDPETGGVIYGQAVYQGNFSRDAVRNSAEWIKNVIYHFYGRVGASGPNGFIKLGNDGRVAQTLAEDLDVNIIQRTDHYVRDKVIEAGGAVASNLSPEAWVFALGDRYPTLQSFVQKVLSPETRIDFYKDWRDNNPDGKKYVSSYSLGIDRW